MLFIHLSFINLRSHSIEGWNEIFDDMSSSICPNALAEMSSQFR